MNLNLTGEFWDMPFNLIGQATEDSSIKFTDWLPLVVVIIGGIFTYYTAIVLERRKRKFDLKRQIYFEVIEIFSAISLFSQESDIDLERANPRTPDDCYEFSEGYKDRWERWSSDKKVIDTLILLKFKLELCETPKDILDNIEKLKNYAVENNFSDMNALIMEELIPALRKEISK